MTQESSTEALSLRVQAQALLEQAHALDGLHPFLLHHTHQYGTTGYVVWGESEPDEKTAGEMVDSQFEPELDETLSVESNVTLQELVGIALAYRIPDVLASLPIHEDDTDTFPQAIRTALNWMDYGLLKELLEEFGIAVQSNESEDDLREAVRANLIDGTIPQSRIDTSKV